jgi:hypothetical protein
MALIETTGGGFIDSGDRRIERKVVVATGGEALTVPNSDQGFPLSNISVTQEPGGIRRGVFEFSQGGEGGASYNQYGKRIELTGGTREVPIQAHKKFEAMTVAEITRVQEEVEKRQQEMLIDLESISVDNIKAEGIILSFGGKSFKFKDLEVIKDESIEDRLRKEFKTKLNDQQQKIRDKINIKINQLLQMHQQKQNELDRKEEILKKKSYKSSHCSLVREVLKLKIFG